MGKMLARIMAGALLVAASACSSADDAEKDPAVQYRKAIEQLIDEDYLEAATKFETVANTTLNPILTQLATVRLGDALYFQGKYAEAAEVYREFQAQFPNAADVPHAAFMRGLCHVSKMPEDVWLLPPAESREMEDVVSAYEAFSLVVDRYPATYYALRSRPKLQEIVERRCRHHVYVASYYSRHDNPKGAVQRLEQALDLEVAEVERKHVGAAFQCATSPSNILFLARMAAQARDPRALERARDAYKDNMGRYQNPERGLQEILALEVSKE